MKTEMLPPNVGNFIKSLRDVGYTFDVAVADILDNSITAQANNIEIYADKEPELIFSILDNGVGMTEDELKEAMRLSSKSPDDKRDAKDLGKFGLGLKTASFSQCKRLTVLSKQNDNISLRQWDLDHIANTNEWSLIIPDLSDFDGYPLVSDLIQLDCGTLVIWEKIDGITQNDFSDSVFKLRSHLSLVFHRFLEKHFSPLRISVNNNPLKPFNPFNITHSATQEKPDEKIKIFDSTITVTPYILPHHSKVNQQEWQQYETEDGYIKSQGFYLYRANRLLLYGTWWGMRKATDAHKLVRIKIDISNDQDDKWGIDIKKSHAKPRHDIKARLKAIIDEITKIGSRPYTGRGGKIHDPSVTKFWVTIPLGNDNQFRYGINKEHPLFQIIRDELESTEIFYLLQKYLSGIEAYLPLDAIQAHLQQHPHNIDQKSAMTESDIEELAIKLKGAGLDEEYIEQFLKTELFKQNKELLQ